MANWMTCASRLEKEIFKLMQNGTSYDDALELSMRGLEVTMDIALNLEERFKAKKIARGDGRALGQYFVTISPRPDVTFDEFFKKCQKMDKNAIFDEYVAVFEQRGLNPEDCGKGFHLHAVISKTKERSKANILEKLKSTFKAVCADNCIRVDHLKTDKDVEQARGYILDSKSKDGHKKETQPYDARWREKAGIQHIYEKGGLSSSSAPRIP